MALPTEQKDYVIDEENPTITLGPLVGTGANAFSPHFRIDNTIFNAFTWTLRKAGLGQPHETLSTADTWAVGIQRSTSPETGYVLVQETTQATAPTSGTSEYTRTTGSGSQEFFRIRWNFADKTTDGNVDRVSRVVPTGTAGATGHLTDADESYTYTSQGTYAYQGLHIQTPTFPKPRMGYPVLVVGTHGVGAPGTEGSYDVNATVPAGTVDGADDTNIGSMALHRGMVYVHFALTGSDSRANDGTTELSGLGLVREIGEAEATDETTHSPTKEYGQVIQYLRANAKSLGINPREIYAYGYESAANCAAASVCWPDLQDTSSSNALKQQSSRPNGLILENVDGYMGSRLYAGTDAWVSQFNNGSDGRATSVLNGALSIIKNSLLEAIQTKASSKAILRVPIAVIHGGPDGSQTTSTTTVDVVTPYTCQAIGNWRPEALNAVGAFTTWSTLMFRRVRDLVAKRQSGNVAPIRCFQTSTTAITGDLADQVDETFATRKLAMEAAMSWFVQETGCQASYDGVGDKAHVYLEITGVVV